MTTQEVKEYWEEKDKSYLSRYDRLASVLVGFAEADDYDQETIRLLENLIELCEEKSAHTKNFAAWHKAMSHVHANDRA